MLISHHHRFIFTKTVKTASTTVELYFERWCMAEGECKSSEGCQEYESSVGVVGCRQAKPPSDSRWWNHMPAALIRDQVGSEIWNDYIKFCTMRNPFDKAISAFYFFAEPRASLRNSDPDGERRRFERWLEEGGLPIDRAQYLIDGVLCVDEVIRYERLHQDVERLCALVGVPWIPGLLGAFKTGIRPQRAVPQQLYTSRSRQLVAEAYAPELELFGYSFPTPVP